MLKEIQFNFYKSTQQTFTCSKSKIETPEKGVKYVKFNNKNTTMTPLASFKYLYC